MDLDPAKVAQIQPLRLAVEEKLLSLPGVNGVDIGFKKVDGVKTDRYAIIVFVERKGDFEKRDGIPARIGDVETDVVEATFKLHKAEVPVGAPGVDAKRYEPAQGGSCISPARRSSGYGTLGMLVKDEKSEESLWLSAYHVMCMDSSWPNADKRIVQPAVGVGGNASTDTIGEIVRGTYGQVDIPWGFDLYVDAAVCRANGRSTSPSIVQLGVPMGVTGAFLNMGVSKYGATTGRRGAKIISTNSTVLVKGERFYYQYMAESGSSSGPFSEPGDSGAPVMNSSGFIVGLVIAGSGNCSVVNPIVQIFEALSLKT